MAIGTSDGYPRLDRQMTPRLKLQLRKLLAHGCLIGIVLVVLVPFLMVIVASLRRGHFPPSTLWVRADQWSLEHWKFVLGIPYQEIVNPATGELRTIQASTPPLLWLWNSVLISCCSSLGIILLSGTAAYAFARMRFKLREPILNALLILQMFPAVLSLVAYYVLLDYIGQHLRVVGLNTIPGLIAIYLAGIAIHIWMIKGYFETIPASMEESARIDGASQFQTFLRILLPISAPIFAVVFILSFIYTMSEYPVASVVLQTSETWTLAVGANSFLYEQEKLWGRFAALAVLGGLPITLVFLLCQRFVIGGLTSGGIKE
jgi:maltose/maltodextrin transport system permease protein